MRAEIRLQSHLCKLGFNDLESFGAYFFLISDNTIKHNISSLVTEPNGCKDVDRVISELIKKKLIKIDGDEVTLLTDVIYYIDE